MFELQQSRNSEAQLATIIRDGMKSVVKSIPGWHCAKCGEVEFAKGQASRYNHALQALKAEALDRDAKELARIRKKRKLTQQQTAMLTGGSKNAFSCYENGQAKPMAAVVNLFRLLERNTKLVKDWECNRRQLRCFPHPHFNI